MRDCCTKPDNHGAWYATAEPNEFMWACKACKAKHITLIVPPGRLELQGKPT